MSQLVQPKLTLPGQIRSNQWFLPVVILLVAAALMAFAIISDDGKPGSLTVDSPQQAQRAGGPDESTVAAAVAQRPASASPVESRIAAAVAAGAESTSTPAETHTPVPIGPLGRRK
jgi:hypothetical protein